jgi:eukaryotic-like serine/threonine-protein kinase
MAAEVPPPAKGRAGDASDPGSATVTQSHPSGRAPAAITALPYMTLLDRFDLMRPLGMGASGAVFEAYDRGTAQTVALKLLHRCEPADLYRIKSEFRALSELAHPNLVAMHELFIDEQQRGFLTMELIRGVPFRDYIRPPAADGGGLAGAEQRLRACLEQLARGVSFLHSRGKLHRDLKPSNVLINPESGHLTILDFGLVQSLQDALPHDAPEAPAFEGTPAYAAPEQADPRATAFASDWYAVGIMLYEALSARRPFGESQTPLRDKALQDPPPPSALSVPLLCPELEPLCLQLIARDPRQRADGSAILRALGRSELPVEAEPALELVGRERELVQLAQAFERALGGTAAALSIQGPSGIGKTSLAHAFLDELRASERAHVLRGRCYVQEALHYNALDGVVDALSDHLRRAPDAELAPLLPRDVAALAQLFPILRRVPAIERACAGARANPLTDLRADAFAALRQLLERLARRRPLALFIDDLQWADADSARLLHELIAPPIPGLWILATERSDALDLPLSSSVEIARLPLGPLSEAAIAELAQRQIAGCPPDRASQIARRSGGHPMFASELIRHARSDAGSEDAQALEAALSARLAGFSAKAKALLDLICLAGQRLPHSLLLEAQVAPPLAALRELRVGSAIRDSLRDDEPHVEAYHDRIREVVMAQLPAARRRELHGALAERMRARGTPYLERAIQGYVLAEREQEAAQLAEQAAKQAAHGLAFHSAAQLFELALKHAQAEPERQRLRLLAADMCAHAGRTLAAAEHWDLAARQVHEPSEQTELQLKAATGFWVAGHGQRGRAIVDSLLGDLGVPSDAAPYPFVPGVAQLLRVLVSDWPVLEPPREEYGRFNRRHLRVIWQLTPCLVMLEPRRSTVFAAGALDLSARMGDAAVLGQCIALCAGTAAFLLGRPSRLIERQFTRAHQLVQQGEGDPWERAFVSVIEACAASFCAHDERAAELCREIATMTQLGSPMAIFVRNNARTIVLLALSWRGRLRQLSELSEAWLKDTIECGDRHTEVSTRTAALVCHLARDDADRALGEIARMRKLELDVHHMWLDYEPRWLANVHLYRGEPEEAFAVCEGMRPNRGLYLNYHDHMRVVWALTEGSCAAALLARGRDRRRWLGVLRRSILAAKLSVGRRSPPMVAQLSASLALFQGKRRRTLAHLRSAIAGYDALDNRLLAASLRLALARLEPDAGHEQRALAVFHEEGVVAPQRFAYMFAPGLVPEP